jgi:hypothetical protein
MKKLSSVFFSLLLIVMSMISSNELSAARRTSLRTYKIRTYTKKAPYSGLGKTSKINGRIKSKGISGHGKRTTKGYTYVNPYARSK